MPDDKNNNQVAEHWNNNECLDCRNCEIKGLIAPPVTSQNNVPVSREASHIDVLDMRGAVADKGIKDDESNE